MNVKKEKFLKEHQPKKQGEKLQLWGTNREEEDIIGLDYRKNNSPIREIQLKPS